MLGIEETQEIAREILRAWSVCVCVCVCVNARAQWLRKRAKMRGNGQFGVKLRRGREGVIYMNQDALLRARKPCFIFSKIG